jgi:phospholipase C
MVTAWWASSRWRVRRHQRIKPVMQVAAERLHHREYDLAQLRLDGDAGEGRLPSAFWLVADVAEVEHQSAAVLDGRLQRNKLPVTSSL